MAKWRKQNGKVLINSGEIMAIALIYYFRHILEHKFCILMQSLKKQSKVSTF